MSKILQPVPLPPLPGLKPVLSPDIHTLILCHYPDKRSCEKGEYHADEQDCFWNIMSALFGKTLQGKSYTKRLQKLLQHSIGLWDVITACNSAGCLDTVLTENMPNRFDFLQQHCPHIGKICLNGKTAGKYAPLFEKAGYTVFALPSTSLTYSLSSFEEKLEIWRQTMQK
ncbi:MAG: DNA-deoxyinosine glycosylase [Oxalobacter formigenes]|nr:DNA-deoxyinosine glycosylase [Oxalobacter formigenes]